MLEKSEFSHLKISRIPRNFKIRVSIVNLGIRNRFLHRIRSSVLHLKSRVRGWHSDVGVFLKPLLLFTGQSKRIGALFGIQCG